MVSNFNQESECKTLNQLSWFCQNKYINPYVNVNWAWKVDHVLEDLGAGKARPVITFKLNGLYTFQTLGGHS